jgi:predicted secreted hydrolase
MESRGTITVNGQTKRVISGQFWLDHQWGDFTQAPDATTFIGWDWFSVRLIDGSFLLVYRIRNAVTGQLINTFGTYVPPQQGKKNSLMKVVPLTASDLTIKVNSTWKSPGTNTEWPLDWNIKVQARAGLPAMEFNTKPIVTDSEVQLGQFPPYWEGPEVVAGKKNQFPIGGLAHLESTGYSFLPPVVG